MVLSQVAGGSPRALLGVGGDPSSEVLRAPMERYRGNLFRDILVTVWQAWRGREKELKVRGKISYLWG